VQNSTTYDGAAFIIVEFSAIIVAFGVTVGYLTTMKRYGIFVVILVISILHYVTPVMYHDMHAVYQRLYYVPIIVCAYWYGFRWGLTAAIVSAVSYLPHIVLHWAHMPAEMFTQYVEILMFLIIGSLTGILSDIQKRQQQEIRDAQKSIRRMDRMSLLGQLAAGLAHEIRNPLGSLIGSDEIIAESLGKEHPNYEFVEILQKEHRRLRDKLNEFLSFARPAPPCILPNNINDIIHATTQLVEKQASKNGCLIATDLDTSIKDIPVDADHIKQVLLNLLLNASQEMSEGGTISVTTRGDRTSISISVCDQGKGISSNNLDRIFEPFYTTKSDGTGLGLAIVKQLVENMNGTISVQSGASGSQFTIRIPYEQKKHLDR
jgi:signal transduction histidine kinase